MKNPVRLVAGLALILVASTGCSPSGTPLTPGGSSGEQSLVVSTLAITPELIDDGQMESGDVGTVSSGPALSGALAAIHPYRFWRSIDRIDRRFEFAFADTDTTGRPTTAVVTIHKLLRGKFNIVVGANGDSVPSDTTRRLIQKPMSDTWVRRVLLKRVDRADGPEPGNRWRVAATSGVDVSSAQYVETVRITSLRVQSGVLDTTITDPLAFFRLRNILRLEPGADVTVTATTLNVDDVVVLVRSGLRMRLTSNGDHTYTGHWTVPGDSGIRHFGVNAMSHGTLFDDTAPYKSDAWIFPYAITSEVLADYRP